MIIREPTVHAVYYYLRDTPSDSPARRQDRHTAFMTDAHRILRVLSGWLAMPAPVLPTISEWQTSPPSQVQPVMQPRVLEGRTNAAASFGAYVLRDMLLLQVRVSRAGEHDQRAWSMLDEALGEQPTTPSWLHTARYWCGIAPRPPEDLEQMHSPPVKIPFGMLCLGEKFIPHLLVYPDARTEKRAHTFLRTLGAQLEGYMVQARYRLETYENHVSDTARSLQSTLDQLRTMPDNQQPLRSLALLQTELSKLEVIYDDVLADLRITTTAEQSIRTLIAEYRLALMQYGLWDAAPTVWEAQVASLAGIQVRIEADVSYVDTTLRRVELMLRVLQTRVALLQNERERLLIYLVALLGVAVLAVLVADTNLPRVAVRLCALGIVSIAAWFGWRTWLQSHLP